MRHFYCIATLLFCLLLLAPIRSFAPRPGSNSLHIQFRDIARQAGLSFLHVSGSAEKKYLLEAMSGGVAWIDYNKDAWPDLYLINGGRWEDLATRKRSVSNALYRNNRDRTFTNVTQEAGLQGNGWGMGVAVGDYNNDGWPDLYICNYGPNILYRNNGNGTFSDVTDKSDVGGLHWSSSAAFADYDQDGWLDLYVTNYVKFDWQNPPAPECQYREIEVFCGPKGMTPESDILYRNNGNGTFSDVTERAGMKVTPSYGLGALWCDFDNDAGLDLYVANDSMPNFMFQNQGSGRFLEIGLLSGTSLNEDGKEQAGMGVASGDYDRDGLLDLFVTNFSDDSNTLYRNLGRGQFRDVSYAADITLPSWRFLGWGKAFFDFDHDGWEDLFVANGHIYPQVDRFRMDVTYLQPKLFFRNLANGRFREISGELGGSLRQPSSSRGAAIADFDNDGDLDLALNNLDASPSLLQNDGASDQGHWLLLSLEGTGRSSRNAIGARVTLETDSGRQIREVQGSSSYQATNDFRLHFGLSRSTSVKSLDVRWPDGMVERFQSVAANRAYSLVQGRRTLARIENSTQ